MSHSKLMGRREFKIPPWKCCRVGCCAWWQERQTTRQQEKRGWLREAWEEVGSDGGVR